MMITQLSRTTLNENKIAKIINVEKLDMENQTKSRVKQMLVEDAENLLQKKRKQEEKKERIRKMEEQFQLKREKKKKFIEEKNNKSQVLREKNKEEATLKYKKTSQNYQKILKKIADDHQHDILKKLDQRRGFQTNHSASKLLSKTSKDNLSRSKIDRSRQNAEDLSQKLEMIDNRYRVAIGKHNQHQNLVISKVREQFKRVQEKNQKAKQLSELEEQQALRNHYIKSLAMQKVYHRAKSLNQKKVNEKRRVLKDKLDKCSQNIRQLQYLEEQKYESIQKKNDREIKAKQWKDPRTEKYLQLFEQNSRKLEMEKEERAQQILSKHTQITQQHKTYKQRKDKLIELIKHG